MPRSVVATPCIDDHESSHVFGEKSEKVPDEAVGTPRFHFLLFALFIVCDRGRGGGSCVADLEACALEEDDKGRGEPDLEL